jgi:LysM repeat protein
MQVNSASTPSSTPLGLEPTHDGMAGVDGGIARQASVTPIRPHVWRHHGQEGHGLHARAHIFKRPAQTSGGWFSRIRHAMQMRVEKVQIQSLQRHAALIPANGHIKTTGWLHGLTVWRAHLRAVVEHLKAPVVAPATTAAATAAVAATASAAAAAAVNPDAAALASVTASVHQRFAAQAGNKEAFNELLHKAFGDKFDAAKAETIRQQTLAGDFSWAPKVEVVSSATLADRSGTQAAGTALGAYAQETDTIYISRELLHSDPSHAGRILMEEMGHGIDARINTSDAVGDEGEIFSKLMHGDKISAEEMAVLKADNDTGVVQINGRNVTVEYGWFKKLCKAVSHGVQSVVKAVVHGAVNLAKATVNVAIGLATMDFNRVKQGFQQGITAIKTTVEEVHQAVKDTAKAIHKIAKEAFIKLMQSKIFAAVLMVCRFIPIPIVQLVVRIIDIVRAAYMVYQGIKNKSLSMVLGGVASIAGGAANVAGSLGASASTVTAIRSVADGASKLSMAYNAVANKDLGSALGLLGGMTTQGTTLNTMAGYAQQAVGVGQAIRTGDTLAAVGGAIGMAGSYNGKDTELGQQLGKAQDAVTGVRALRELDRGNLDAAQSLASSTNLAQATSKQADDTAARERAEEKAKAAAEQAQQAEKKAQAQESVKFADEATNDREAEAANTNKPAEPAEEAKPSTSTAVKIAKGDTLEAIAREHYGENWKAGIALMAMDNGLKLNQWGSPVLREGKPLVINDLGERSSEDLAKLSRMGGNIVAGNSRGLQAKAEMEQRVQVAKETERREQIKQDVDRIQGTTRYTQTDRDSDPNHQMVLDANKRIAAYAPPALVSTPEETLTSSFDSVVGMFSDFKAHNRNGVEEFGVSGGGNVKTVIASVTHAASEIGYTMVDAGLALGRLGTVSYDSLNAGTFIEDFKNNVSEPALKFATALKDSDVVRISAGAALPDKSADGKIMIGTDRVGVQYKVGGPVDSVNRLTYRWGDTQMRDEMLIEKNLTKIPVLSSGNIGGLPVSVDVVPGVRLNLSGNRVATPSVNIDLNIASQLLKDYKPKITLEIRKSGS